MDWGALKKISKIIQGLCRWTSVSTPNTRFTPTYYIEVEVPEDTYNDYLEQGFPVKDEDGFYMVIKRKVERRDGSMNIRPKLFNYKKEPTDVTIGNGSLVRVLYQEFVVENKFGTFKGFDLRAVQILDLIKDDDLPDDFLIDYKL